MKILIMNFINLIQKTPKNLQIKWKKKNKFKEKTNKNTNIILSNKKLKSLVNIGWIQQNKISKIEIISKL